jgi:hypothetical protein
MTDSSEGGSEFKWGLRVWVLIGLVGGLMYLPFLIVTATLRWVVLAGAMVIDALTSRLLGFRLFEACRVDDWHLSFPDMPDDDEALRKWLASRPCVVESTVVRDQHEIRLRCLRRGPLLRFVELHEASVQQARRLGYDGCCCVIVNEPRHF